ncbi:hypothetical protein [Natronococcus sp.]|uniref:hypothetical protein n=1 Tax=Natronococcus sp. TaxID=35747 RepID=UPI003A4E3620
MLDPNLGTAVLRTKLDAAGLSTGLGQAEQQIRAFSDRSSLSLAKVAEGATRTGRALSIGVTAPLVAVATAATNAALRLGNTADQLLDLEQQSGLSVDRLQAFGRVARAAGVDAGVLGDAAIQLSRRLREGGEESAEFAAAAQALGVSVRDSAGNLRALDDVVPELITSLQGVQDVTTRNVLANQAFGRGATALIPVLALTADEYARLEQEARDAGEVLGRDALESANALRVGYEDLKAEVGVLGRDLTVALLPAVTQVVGLFRDVALPALRSTAEVVGRLASGFGELPPVVQRVIVVVGGLAAAAGPLLLVIGKLLTAVQAIGPALAVLKVAALPLLGPAGIIAGAVLTVGGLALAFSGRSESLDTALENVSRAAAGGDQASVVSALERLKERVDQSAVPAIQRMIDKLQETGELSAELRAELDQLVTGFNRTAAEAELASVRTRIAALEAQGIGAREDTGDPTQFLPFRQEQLDRALVNAGFNQGDLRFELDESGAVTLRAFTDALRSSRDPSVARLPTDPIIQQVVFDTIQAARADTNDLLSPLLRRQAELERQLAGAPRPAAGGGFAGGASGGGGGAGGGSASAATRRTVKTVFDEIAARGAAAVRIAAFEGTPEAALEGIETRIRLFDRAVEELLTSFAGEVSEAQLEYIRERRAALRAEAERLRAALKDADEAAKTEIERILDPGARARLVAKARTEAGAIALDTVLSTVAAEIFDPAAFLDALAALRRVSPALASEFDELAQVARIATATFASGFVDPGTRARLAAEAREGATAIALDTVQAYAAAFEAGAEGLDPDEGLVALRRLRELSPELAREFDGLARSLALLAAAAKDTSSTFVAPGAPDPNRSAAVAIALDTAAAFAEAFRAGEDLDPQDGLAAIARLRALAPELATAFDALNRELLITKAALTESPFADPGQLAAARAEQAALARLIAVDTVEALIAAGAETDDLVAALERLRAIAPEAAAAFDERLARPIPIPGVETAIKPPQGLEGIFGPGTTDEFRGIFGESGQQLVTASEYSSAEIQDAAVRFSAQVAQAAIDFTFGLIEAIKKGDVAGAIGQGLNLAGSVAGGLATFGGALGLSAAAVSTAGIAAIALPLIGGLVSGLANLFGGNRGAQAQESERDAEARRRARQTPAFSVRISVSQTNNYSATNADPQIRADNDRRTRAIVADVLREIDFPALRRAALGSPL